MTTKDRHRALMLRVLKQFRVLLRSMDTHYRQVEHRSGLGGAQLWALSEISVRGGLTVGELAGKLAVHLSTASNLVTRLQELGLVARSRSRSDQRIVRIRATPAGRRRLREAPAPFAGLLQNALYNLSSRDLEGLEKQLTALLGNVEQLDRRASARPLGELLGGPSRGT